jgi:hypothetical protein
MSTRSGCFIALVAIGSVAYAGSPDLPKHELPPAKNGGLVVGMCDGKTAVEFQGLTPGRVTREQGRAVADQLMIEWRKKNPDARWDEAPVLAQAPAQSEQAKQGARTGQGAAATSGPSGGARSPPAVDSKSPAPGTQQVPSKMSNTTSAEQTQPGLQRNTQVGHTYGAFSERDEAIWRASVEQIVEEGNKIFHDADRLGSVVAMSCDMCHPDAANTHPETYPKYQVQLGRVALLRDMINWCIENPVRGKPLEDDDPRMKALESFITAKRKGVPLEFGKH